MQKKEIKIEPEKREGDILFDYFRENLEDYSMPVDEKCWAQINQNIRPVKTLRLSMALYAGVAAAAVILLFLFLGRDVDIPHMEHRATNNEEPVKIKQQLNDVIKQRSPTLKIGVNYNQQLLAINSLEYQQVESTEDTLANSEKESVIEPDEAMKEEPVKKEAKTVKKSNAYAKENYSLHEDMTCKNRDLKWTASVSSYGISSKTQNDQMNFSRATGLLPSDGEHFLLTAVQPEEVEYAAPLSFSLLARRSLSKNWAVESGLTYSYLSTTYRTKDRQLFTSSLKLHYIGIPVTLVANIWKITPQWKLYASSGFMVEKGIKFDFTQQASETQQTITYIQNIKGLQWSANASVGLSYQFLGKLNFYLEPRLSTFFENGQPVSIRTEKRTIVGLNSGFRYDF